MPPTDHPMMCAFSIFKKAINPLVSSANSSIVYGVLGLSDFPDPRLSNLTTLKY